MTTSPTHSDAASEVIHRLIRDALTASDLGPDTPSPEGSSELHLLPQVLPHLHLPSGLIPKLIADGADIEATDRAGRTPLHLAAQYGRNADLVKALLAAGADPEACDENRQTPLHRAAAFSDNADVSKALLEAGAARNARDDRDQTPLHLAAREGRLGAVTTLLAAGADIEARDEDGATPLHLAIARNDAAEVVAALKSAGKIGNDRDEWGRTPMDYCRSEQTYAAGESGVRPGEEDEKDFLRWMRKQSLIVHIFLVVMASIYLLVSWEEDEKDLCFVQWMRKKQSLIVCIFLVVIASIYLLVSWPVSWLAYWLIEDTFWRHGVTIIVSALGTVWFGCRRVPGWIIAVAYGRNQSKSHIRDERSIE